MSQLSTIIKNSQRKAQRVQRGLDALERLDFPLQVAAQKESRLNELIEPSQEQLNKSLIELEARAHKLDDVENLINELRERK